MPAVDENERRQEAFLSLIHYAAVGKHDRPDAYTRYMAAAISVVSATILFLLLACVAWSLGSGTTLARSPHVERHQASLLCGQTRFSMRSAFINSAPLSQSITARRDATHSAIKVDLRQTKIPYSFELGAAKGLASFVDAWQCRKTPAGHVLVLWYVCPVTLLEYAPHSLCSVTREWERYVALDGSLLDQGFSFDDERYDALRAKLGYHDNPDQSGDEGPFIWFLSPRP